MALHPRFKDEAEFREQFVKPFLNKLGFFGVTHSHGTQEFGKDFVFSEIHRLGGIRHFAAQVKHAESIGQGKVVGELLTQIQQAFAKPFLRPDSPRECYVSAVYVFNSGKISDNAKEQLLSELGRERYGDNVHFLDGDRLESLNQNFTLQNDREIRSRLLALFNQLELNWGILNSIAINDIKTTIEGRPILYHGVEEMMSSPIEASCIKTESLYKFWQLCRVVESILRRLIFQVGFTEEARNKEIATMQKIANDARMIARDIQLDLSLAIARFQPII